MNTLFTNRVLILLLTFAINPVLTNAQKPGSYSSLYFDGANDHVLISDDTSLNPRDEITVEAWIRSDSFGTNIYDNSVFCKHGWSAGNAGYVLRVGAGGGVSFNVSGRAAGGAWQEANNTSSILKTGVWYHLAGTFDGDSVNVYVNGVLMATKLYTGLINVSTGLNAKIGELAYGSGRNFKGEIDEVRLWRSALSDSLLREYMCQKVTKAHPQYANLVGYWKLDEKTGTSGNDNSPWNNDGSLRNGPRWANSGAPLGDSSVVGYGNSILQMASAEKDVFEVRTSSGSSGWTHIYLINDTTTNPSGAGSKVLLDSSHYFGVYTTSPLATYSASLDYGAHNVNGTSDECGADLLIKQTGGGGTWESGKATFFGNGDSLVQTGLTSSEFMLGIYPMDSNKILTTETGDPWFCSADGVTLIASGNGSFNYTWFKNDTAIANADSSRLWVNSVGDYHVELERPSVCKVTSPVLKLTRKQSPTVSLSAIASVCEDADTVILSGGSPSKGRFIAKGLVNDSMLVPRSLGAGVYDVVYEYTDSNNCAGRDTQSFEVWALPNVFVSSSTRICNNLDTVALTAGRPIGGDYTGSGIYNNSFIPANVSRNAGKYPFKYAFTDSNGCYAYTNDTVILLQTTKATLSPLGDQCELNDPVKITAFPTGGQLSGPGITGNLFYPKSTGAGVFTLTYRYVNSVGCTDIDTEIVVVHANTPVTWNFNPEICVNSDSLQLDEGSPKGGRFYGPGITGTDYFHPNLTGSGSHTIYYEYKDSNQCLNKAQTQVSVKDTASLSKTDIGNVCSATKVMLNHVQPSGGTYFGPGVTNGELLPWDTDTGDIFVRYTYVDNGCTSTIKLQGYIVPPTDLGVEYPASVCEDTDPFRLIAQPEGGNFSGNGVISGLFSPSFAGPGNHSITYSFTDSFGCVSERIDSIWVNEVPVAETQSYFSICEDGDRFTLDFGNTNPGFGHYYRHQTDTLSEVIPSEWGAGSYRVYFVLYATAGCKDSAFTDLIIHPLPDKAVITLSGNRLISSALNGNQWHNLDGPITGETGREFDPSENGDYFVVVTSDSGCTSVSDTLQFEYVGLEVINKALLHVVPNPSNGILRIEGLKVIDQVYVYDITGKLAMYLDDVSNGNLDLSALPNGKYQLVCIARGHLYQVNVVLNRD